MPNALRIPLLGVVAVSVSVVGSWLGITRSRRLREGRGDIRAMPLALFGRYGLPWSYAAVPIVCGHSSARSLHSRLGSDDASDNGLLSAAGT
jgi:hypothetical protein